MGRPSVIKVNHSYLGECCIKLDKEDKEYLLNRKITIQTESARDVPPYVVLLNDRENYKENACRTILKNRGYNLLNKKVSYKDGDHFNLQKKNLIFTVE